MIASKRGVVTAEEMAPYLDLPKGGAKRGDEGYVVPALLKFGGHPEVDEQGNLLYSFPDLQKSASASMVRLLNPFVALFLVVLLYVLCKGVGFDQLLHDAVMFVGINLRCVQEVMCCFRGRLAALLRSIRTPGPLLALETNLHCLLQRQGVVDKALYKAQWQLTKAEGQNKVWAIALVSYLLASSVCIGVLQSSLLCRIVQRLLSFAGNQCFSTLLYGILQNMK